MSCFARQPAEIRGRIEQSSGADLQEAQADRREAETVCGLFDEDDYADELSKLLSEVFPLCKESQFQREHEVRLIACPELSASGPTGRSQVRSRESGTKTLTFVRSSELLSGFQLPIEHILVGPTAACNDFDLLYQAGAARGISIERVRPDPG